MEYEFEPGLIAEPKQYDLHGLTPPGTLSAVDKQWVRKWYPPQQASLTALQPFQSTVADLAAGQQADFVIEPPATRKYTIEVKGATDALLVLFEEIDGTPRYLSGDDDSGQERSATLTYKLFQGRKYIARVRLVHPGPSGKMALLYW